MYNLFSLLLILISLSIIAFIVTRKFSLLSNVDVENIPAEKQFKVKEQILKKRLERKASKHLSSFLKMTKDLTYRTSGLMGKFNEKLQKIKSRYRLDKYDLSEEENTQIAEKLFEQANDFIKKEEYGEAENKLIEIISLDNKNIQAFKLLAEIYSKMKKYNEAKQTFGHILKIMEAEEDFQMYGIKEGDGRKGENSREIAQIYFELALVDKKTENIEESINNLKIALKIEPNNPRYLDTMIDLAIINKDKILALDAYDNLKKINPENKKLDDFRERIREL